MRALVREWNAAAKTIGLVPTMGALHAGHMSLVSAARAETSKVVVSIFVNPLQFGPGEDLERYPRPVEADLAMLRDAGVDAVYMPDRSTVYPPESSTRVHVGGVSEPLEGAHRPGHFEGVATVVTKLFGATHPDRAYFGQKDAQQVAVVKRLAADLDSGVEIRVCPTIRDADGLAVSSRNAYLSVAERGAALSLSRSLRTAAQKYASGERDTDRLRARIHEVLAAEPLVRIDYAELVDASTFRAPGTLAVLAVKVGKTRLIDNHDVSKPFPG
jgi:pantoate--beta-alanine ligase